jgi:dTDP-4-amino-4,6-dideoxygalactose transaminase
VYVDIDPVTYNLDPALIEATLTARTKLVIAQHTYGYPCDMDAILAIAEAHDVPVIEDCCLTLGSRYKNKPVGSFGVASYYSFQWNKPYTSGLGGMATTRDPELAARILAVRDEHAVAPGRVEVAVLACQLAAYRTLVYPRTTALAQTIFRWLTKRGAAVGSSSTAEYAPNMPDDFLKRMSALQASVGLRQLGRLDHYAAHRRSMRQTYDALLDAIDWPRPRVPDHLDCVMVRYPVRVADKTRALADAARHFVELGSWFECPLHPIETPLEDYGYRIGMCPEAERASREVVNLPLHPRANVAVARRTVDFISRIGPARAR